MLPEIVGLLLKVLHRVRLWQVADRPELLHLLLGDENRGLES